MLENSCCYFLLCSSSFSFFLLSSSLFWGVSCCYLLSELPSLLLVLVIGSRFTIRYHGRYAKRPSWWRRRWWCVIFFFSNEVFADVVSWHCRCWSQTRLLRRWGIRFRWKVKISITHHHLHNQDSVFMLEEISFSLTKTSSPSPNRSPIQSASSPDEVVGWSKSSPKSPSMDGRDESSLNWSVKNSKPNDAKAFLSSSSSPSASFAVLASCWLTMAESSGTRAASPWIDGREKSSLDWSEIRAVCADVAPVKCCWLKVITWLVMFPACADVATGGGW